MEYIFSSSLSLSGLSHPPQQQGGYYQSDERQAQSTYRLFNQLLALLELLLYKQRYVAQMKRNDRQNLIGRRGAKKFSFSLTEKNNKKQPSIFSFFLNATTSSLSWRLLQHSLALLSPGFWQTQWIVVEQEEEMCMITTKTHPCVSVCVLSICFNRFDIQNTSFFYLFFSQITSSSTRSNLPIVV